MASRISINFKSQKSQDTQSEKNRGEKVAKKNNLYFCVKPTKLNKKETTFS